MDNIISGRYYIVHDAACAELSVISCTCTYYEKQQRNDTVINTTNAVIIINDRTRDTMPDMKKTLSNELTAMVTMVMLR